MTLPYGALAVVAAAALAMLGAREAAVKVAVGGVVVAAAAVLSLKQWRNDNKSTPVTLLSAGNMPSAHPYGSIFLAAQPSVHLVGAAGYVGYSCWGFLQSGIVPWLTGSIAALSGALALFSLYNVAAGGNPPKRK